MPHLFLFSADNLKQSSTVQSSPQPAVPATPEDRTTVSCKKMSAYGKSVVLQIGLLPRK